MDQRAPFCTPGQGGVDVRGVDDARAGQDREGRQRGANVDRRGQNRDRQDALQVGLPVDQERPGASLDPRQAGFVHVERGERDIGRAARLFDPDGRRVRVTCRNGDHAVDGFIFQDPGLDRHGHGGRVTERGCRQRQPGGLGTACGHGIRHALTARFGIGGTRQGVHARHVLLAMRGEILNACDAGRIVLVADVVDGTQFARLVGTARLPGSR